jgi:hypothetical protein
VGLGGSEGDAEGPCCQGCFVDGSGGVVGLCPREEQPVLEAFELVGEIFYGVKEQAHGRSGRSPAVSRPFLFRSGRRPRCDPEEAMAPASLR